MELLKFYYPGPEDFKGFTGEMHLVSHSGLLTFDLKTVIAKNKSGLPG